MLAPVTLRDPVAPLVALRALDLSLDLSLLDHSMRAAESSSDVVIVEGAGGLLVPITERLSYDGLFARWSLDLVIVAANRLGTINHTRLTVAAARRASLPIRAVVLNTVGRDTDPSMPDNARVIAELEDVPVVELPWMADLDDLEPAFELLKPYVLPELEFSR
jgi:dethiobiotin synthetase